MGVPPLERSREWGEELLGLFRNAARCGARPRDPGAHSKDPLGPVVRITPQTRGGADKVRPIPCDLTHTAGPGRPAARGPPRCDTTRRDPDRAHGPCHGPPPGETVRRRPYEVQEHEA
ncbi:hypothetical protein GCM10011428_02280 [Streptomyces violaceus]